MEEKKREVRIGESRIYLDEANVLNIVPVGEIDESKAIQANRAFYELANIIEGKVDVLVDISRTGQPSTEARMIFQEFSDNVKWRKIALFGLHTVAKMIASFAIGIKKNRKVRFFKTKEEALAWLKE